MKADDLPAVRQALEAGDLKHEMVLGILEIIEEQKALLEAEKHRADLANQWARMHNTGRKKAEQELLVALEKVVRDSAALARLWLKNEFPKQFPGGQKPTKEELRLATLVTNGIHDYIMKQIPEN